MPDLWVGFPDYYGLHRVAPDASDVEVRSAWRAAAKRWHPDMNSGQDDAAMMRKVNEAWQVLGDRDARAVYDEVYFAWRTGSEQLSVELSSRLDMQRERRQSRAKAAEWVRWGREDRGRWEREEGDGARNEARDARRQGERRAREQGARANGRDSREARQSHAGSQPNRDNTEHGARQQGLDDAGKWVIVLLVFGAITILVIVGLAASDPW